MAAERATALNFARPQQGPFSLAIYKSVLEKVIAGEVFTLTVSTGDEERVFFFTRGAILFLAVGTSGGEVVARKIAARGLLASAKLDELVKRANSGTHLLQDLLREEMLLDAKVVASVVEETIEDHLLEVMLWENALALFDLVPGNPPTRLYDPDVPAVRLSVGAKPLLERALGKREETLRILGALGALRNRVRLADGAAIEGPLAAHVAASPRPIGEVLVQAQLAGEPAWRVASALAALIQAKTVDLERVPERSKQEELAQALRIEDAFEGFLNRLLARTHLAAIYERAAEKEKAAEQYRGIAEEHLKRDSVDQGVAALRNVTRLLPQDVGARELLVKVLRAANRAGEAAREAVELARVFLEQNFPGRARQALELALRLAPGSTPVLWMLAGLLKLLGEDEAAIRRFEEIAAIAKKNGDQEAEVAALQQVLEIDPRHGAALEVVRRLSGYKDALRRRIAAAGASFLVFLLVVVYGTYEIAAFSAYRSAREQARAALDDARFDVARSAVEQFRNGWSWTRLRSSAAALGRAIDDEEKLWRTQRSLEAERAAKELEAKDALPAARERWRAAAAFAPDPERQRALEGAAAACEAKIARVADDLERARGLDREGRSQQAYELLAQVLPRAPWLAEDPDFRVPLLLDSVPREARITFGGQLQEKPTPLLLRRPITPVRVRLDGRNREPLEREIAGPQPWPLVLVLPRKPVWRAAEVVASGSPLVLRDAVLVGGVDRSLTAVARDTGAVKWRVALGVFGECDAPPAALETGGFAARSRSGALHLVSAAGALRASLELEPPPFEPLETHAGRPLATAKGVLVRAGSRGLVLVGPDGKTVWEKRAEADLIGAPALSGDVVLVAAEKRLLGFKAATGEPAWPARPLPANPVLGPVAGPKGAVFVPLEDGVVAIVETSGRVVPVRDRFEQGATAIDGDFRAVLVGSAAGDVVALDEAGKVLFRSYTDQQRPVTWVRATSFGLMFGDPLTLYVLDREGKELWRHPVAEGAPAAADDRQVFQGSPEGLSSYDR